MTAPRTIAHDRRNPRPAAARSFDRRAESRLKFGLSLPLVAVGTDGLLGEVQEVALLDLSLSGIGLHCRGAVPPGERAVIQMVDRGGRPNLVGLQIVHARKHVSGGWSIGARFMVLPQAFVRRRLVRSDGTLIDLRDRLVRAAG